MSGHSKWKNIMHKKGKTDAQRAKVFTKIGREMQIAIKAGGADPAANSKLKDLIAKAKSNNVPNDNIDRAIKKAMGETDVVYEEITYEGYGPSGVAIIVEATTDNRNRTGSEMRHYFDKHGGNLGSTGCVSYMFADKGVIVVESEGIDEDKLMEDALEVGAVDFTSDDEVFEIFTDPMELSQIRDDLEKRGYSFASAEVEKIPSMYVKLEDEDDLTKFGKLMDMLEDNDDVQNVWHNLQD